VANAGIFTHGLGHEMTPETWQRTIDVDLTGVWNTTNVSTPYLIEAGGGSIILISSTAGMMGNIGLGAYAAAKHGVVGLMRSLAVELGDHWIRVNTVHPGNVATKILLNDGLFRRFRPDLDNPTVDDTKPAFQAMSVLPAPFVQPEDVSSAVLFLASDESRYITGLRMTVDMGTTIKGARLFSPVG
jgi:(+)-trans-carveol dehydrogenase